MMVVNNVFCYDKLIALLLCLGKQNYMRVMIRKFSWLKIRKA